MPMIIRPSEMSCSVAYALASTVGSRVPGFVTMWPSLIFDVRSATSASTGKDSCQSTCESYVQAYSKPCCSASCMSSIKRWYGGSGRTVTPNESDMRGSLIGQNRPGEDHLRRAELRGAGGGVGRRPADGAAPLLEVREHARGAGRADR